MHKKLYLSSASIIRFKKRHKHNTTLYEEDGCICVKLHSTVIVRFNDDRIILDSNKWHTATTRRRINQVAEAFRLNYYVISNYGNWIVDIYPNNYRAPIGSKPFTDGIVIEQEGSYGLKGAR